MKLNNNKILITGGSRGIGLALTKMFAERNNKIIIVSKNNNRPEILEKYGESIIYIKCDLTNTQEFETLLVKLENEHSDINIIVNNAAIQFNYYFLEENRLNSKIEAEINLNLNVPIKLSTNLLPILSNKSEAAIVNISSGLAIAPKEIASVYCATKAAIHSFSQSLRYQLENTNIKVFELFPPVVNTDMTQGRGKDKMEPDVLAKKFMQSFEQNEFEILVGKIKLLQLINLISPKLAKKILRKSQ